MLGLINISHLFFYLVCKSCLVKHLEENNSCPTCQIVIHQSHPLQYISFDRTMQDIVFKLVPGLQLGKFLLRKYHNIDRILIYLLNLDEIKREREFYRIRGLPYPKEVPAGTEVDDDKTAQDQAAADSDYHRTDEQVKPIIFIYFSFM